MRLIDLIMRAESTHRSAECENRLVEMPYEQERCAAIYFDWTS